MMVRATRDEQAELLDYLAEDVENCLYLYLDIYQYGIGSDTVDVWYSKADGGYTLITLQYFDCLQIYSRHDDFDKSDLLKRVSESGVAKVRGPRSTIEWVCDELHGDFTAEYGAVIEKVRTHRFEQQFHDVAVAGEQDLPEVVDLLLLDERNRNTYSRQGLLNSLANLTRTGTGATYIVRSDGRIVASETIAAESDVFIITAHLITHPDYRRMLYGSVVESYVYNIVKKDRRLFTFVVEPRRKQMLVAQGNPVIAEYGKLIRVNR